MTHCVHSYDSRLARLDSLRSSNSTCSAACRHSRPTYDLCRFVSMRRSITDVNRLPRWFYQSETCCCRRSLVVLSHVDPCSLGVSIQRCRWPNVQHDSLIGVCISCASIYYTTSYSSAFISINNSTKLNRKETIQCFPTYFQPKHPSSNLFNRWHTAVTLTIC